MGEKQEILVNRVGEMRRAKGVTQEGLAISVGVTRQTIIAIEKGNYVPSVLLSLKVAKYFNTPLEEIFYSQPC
ncbi:MAG: helix-turn-helix transcriptional regulator [Candidatus Peregrinibacteria bacterium]